MASVQTCSVLCGARTLRTFIGVCHGSGTSTGIQNNLLISNFYPSKSNQRRLGEQWSSIALCSEILLSVPVRLVIVPTPTRCRRGSQQASELSNADRVVQRRHHSTRTECCRRFVTSRWNRQPPSALWKPC